MEIKGKVIAILPLVEGEGKNGTWRKQMFVIETQDQYPKKVCIAIWGNNIDKFNVADGEMVNVGFDLESREYNGKWFTEPKAWKIDKEGQGSSTSSETPFPSEEPSIPGNPEMDDLPF